MENTNGNADQKPQSSKMAWLVAVIVLVGVVVALNNVEKKPEAEVSELGQEEDVLVETSIDAKSAVVVADPDQALPYTKALAKYAGSKISFNSRCAASPTRLELENETKVMLDNRGAQPITIRFAGQQFSVPAYNFIFYTLQEAELPAVYSVSCGDVKDVARVTVTQ